MSSSHIAHEIVMSSVKTRSSPELSLKRGLCTLNGLICRVLEIKISTRLSTTMKRAVNDRLEISGCQFLVQILNTVS